MGTDVVNIATLITAIASLVGVLLVHFRTRGNIDADTAQKYQIVADKAAERALKLEERIDKLTDRTSELEKDNIELKQEVSIYKRAVKRLIHQLKSLGHEPVVTLENNQSKE